MASDEPPAISTPSRPRSSLNPKQSGTFTTATNAPNVAGFSPGGQVFEGYSYLSRSTSMSTSTRSRPKGLQSRPSEFGLSLTTSPPPAAGRNLPTSPSSPIAQYSAISPVCSPFPHTLDLPKRSKTVHRMPSSISTPELMSVSIHAPRSESETERLAEAVANLPHNPKVWLPSQVALYLTHVLGLVPRPVVEDVTAYVRSSRMGGRAFLRLSEKELERQGLNLKWRKLMIEAVRKLRRDALRGRIWGYESGSLRWPKSAKEVQREEDEDQDGSPDDDQDASQQDGVARSSKTTSKLTLKRMRDSRKVRGMIEAFQTSPTTESMPLSDRSIDAVYAQGFVRDQAQQLLAEAEEKKLSLRRPLRPRRSTADFPWLEGGPVTTKREDVEALLVSLTEQEALDLANELGLKDLQDTEAVSWALEDDREGKLHQRREGSSESADNVLRMPSLIRHNSADTASVDGESSVSECSEHESDLNLTQDDDFDKPRFGVLDEDVIRAILAGDDSTPAAAEQTTADESAEVETSTKSELTRSHTTASILRPSRPYRASLYTDDELAALDRDQLHTRTESSRELVEALMSTDQTTDNEIAKPDFGTARLRAAAGDTAPAIPHFEDSPQPLQDSPKQASAEETAQANNEGDEYIFHLPDEPVRKPAGSIRGTVGRKATFGSKRGKAVLSLLNADAQQSELFSSLRGTAMLRQKSSSSNATAEDEEGWGGTLGRTSSRKGLTGVFDSSVARRSMLPRRGLERVASEAEGEALQADMEALEIEQQTVPEEEVAVPVERYEETVLSEQEGRDGLRRGASVEQRLSSLFKQGSPAATVEEVDAVTVHVAPSVTDENQDEQAPADGGVSEQEDNPAIEDGDVVAAERADPVLMDTPVSTGLDTSQEPIDEAEDISPPHIPPSDDSAAEEPSALPAIAKITADEAAEEAPYNFDNAAADEPPAATATDATPSAADEDSFEIVSSSVEPIIVPEAAVEPALHSPLPPAEAQLLVPLTQLEPHPSGTGSIKKRSMVLVDRKKFESLARRMTHLEAQLEAFDRPSSRKSTVKGSSGLKDMFAAPAEEEDVEDEETVLEEMLAAAILPTASAERVEQFEVQDAPESTTAPKEKRGWKSLISPSSWATYLSSLNPYYSQATPATPVSSSEDEDAELDLYALLGRHESEHERHMLSIGAIPAYMLGLGAGVGFVLVKEVLGRH
ncbi:hypothetical protein PSEUBRA_005778 [Kalmanozyma brasiliensis GHG001]|uniref:SAM domain-containing protein n=1 Tax=Kalmanozyma brasiliensis (strain GHG001) TaxID=1365824 RepID=V5GG23_KALBG|nr:uncharacterized protein PSEUBRA_005778 [Kalmanozyma brasiliensis GHG001]EST04977.1 hypothetical protein PSEUBRA_005778 [Kalmanozyma brasiliensis GHG001]